MRVGHFVSFDGVEPGMEARVSGHVKVPLLGARAQQRNGLHVELITTRLQPGKVLGIDRDPLMPWHQLSLLRAESGQLRHFPRLVRELVGLAHEREYDVLHVWGFSRHAEMAGLASLLGMRIPVVATLFAPPESAPSRVRRILWSQLAAVLVTTETTRLALAGVGIDASLVRHGTTRDLVGEASPMTWQSPRRRVLFWRELTHMNGGDVAVDAFRLLAPRHSSVTFTFALRRSGEIEVEIPEAREANIEVVRAPYPRGQSLADLVGESLCIALPFRSLSMNPQLAVIESLAAGVPVITTDVASNREFVFPGVTGTLIPADDVGALVAAIDEMLADRGRAQQMGKGAADLMQSWNWDAFARQLEEAYLDVRPQ